MSEVSIKTYSEKDDQSLSERVDTIIEQAKKCTERGEGKGKAHVFLDHSDICECGSVDLNRERMK